MRVLQFSKFYPPDPGGIETAAFTLSEYLWQRGVDLTVLCVHRGPGLLQESARSGYPVWRAPAPWLLASMPLSPRLLSCAGALLRDQDILHVHMPNPMAAAAIWLWRPKARIILHWHSDVVRQRITLALYRPLQRWILRRADAVIATSPAYAEASPELRSVREKVHIVPIGIEDPQAAVEPAALALRRSAARNRRTVLAVGRMSYYKGFDILIRAAALLPEDVEVRIVGDGELLEAHRSLTERLGLTHRVTFTGRLDDAALRVEHAAADVFCLPSTHRSEAFGVVMLEAMALGRPVVSSHIQGSGVGWVNLCGLTGTTVAPGDAVALAGALRRLLDNPALARRMGAAARRRFEDCFRADNMGRHTLDLYRALLRR